MSSGKMEMHPEKVRAIASTVGSLADKLDAAKTKLDAELQATDGSWGGDDAGRDFAKDHVPGTQTSEDNNAGLSGAFRTLSTALTQAADEAEDTDEEQASGLRAQA